MLKLPRKRMCFSLSKWCVLSHILCLLSDYLARRPLGSLVTGQGTRPACFLAEYPFPRLCCSVRHSWVSFSTGRSLRALLVQGVCVFARLSHAIDALRIGEFHWNIFVEHNTHANISASVGKGFAVMVLPGQRSPTLSKYKFTLSSETAY